MKKKTLSYLAGRIVPAGLAFASTLAYMPLIGASEYGRFAVLFAIVNILNLSIFQWLRVGYTRLYVRQTEDGNTLTAIALAMTLGGCAAVALVAAIVAAFLPGTALEALSVSLMLASLALSDVNLETLRAKQSASAYALTFATRQCIISAASLWLAIHGHGHLGLVAGMCIGNMATASVSLLGRASPLLRADHARWRALTRQLITYGWPLSINYFLSAIMNSADRLIVNALLGPAATGIYSFASDIAKQSVMTIMEAINLAAFPQVASTYDMSGELAARRQLAQNFEIINAAALPAVAGIASISLSLASLSTDGGSAIVVACLMSMIALATYFRGLRVYYFDQAFQLGSNTIGALKGGMLSSAILLIACPILVISMGVTGAALASIIAFGSALLFSRSLGRASFLMPTPAPAVLRPIIAAGIMAAAVLSTSTHGDGFLSIARSVAVGAGIYVFTMVLLNSFGLGARALHAVRRFVKR